MTSIFGTFRRKKKSSIDQGSSSSSPLRASTVFNSTPNLLKVDHSISNPKNANLLPSKFNIPTKNGNRKDEIQKEDAVISNPNKSGASASDNSNAEAFNNVNNVNGPDTPILVKRGSTTSMKSFMSMMNVMGTLKRSKSIRKLGWGSTVNVNSTTQPNKRSSIRSKKSSKSKSAEFLDTDTDLPPDFPTKSRNNEPGVGSSSSEYSENSSLQDATSIRASSERSEDPEVEAYDSDSDLMDEKQKDPVELERKKNILIGTKKFNMDPKKGIEFLIEKGIFQYTPEDVARFLKDGSGLSKASIGTYLGERIDFNELVLKSFVSLFSFTNLNLVQALRQFLFQFRLPGESQKISRMLDAFAEHYCLANPNLCSAETCSILCYSIIMLNTELHNPNVRDKVTLDQFIKRNRGIEGGHLFTDSFMTTLYNSILTEPFKFPQEDRNDLYLTFFNPDYEGWLYKLSVGRGLTNKTWKRLWFILSNNCLYYFKFTTDKTPKGIIPLENVLVKVPPEDKGGKRKLFVLILYKEAVQGVQDGIKMCKTESDGGVVHKVYSSVQLATPDRKERERWVRAINANHSMSRVYSDLTLRKMKKEQERMKAANANSGSKPNLRKSQISLPSSTSSTSTLPLSQGVPEQPYYKDPNSFFKEKNNSFISLLSADSDLGSRKPIPPFLTSAVPGSPLARSRSRSESRIYQSQRERAQAQRLESPVVHRKLLNEKKEDSLLKKKEEEQLGKGMAKEENLGLDRSDPDLAAIVDDVPRPQNPALLYPEPIIQLRASPTLFDKYKKLSMINELMRSESQEEKVSELEPVQELRKSQLEVETKPESVSDSDSAGEDSDDSDADSDANSEFGFDYGVLKEDKDSDCTLVNARKRTQSGSSSSSDCKSEITGQGQRDFLFPEKSGSKEYLLNISSVSASASPLLEDSCQVQIIDCSKPNPSGKSKVIDFNETNNNVSDNSHIPEICYESIYESNV